MSYFSYTLKNILKKRIITAFCLCFCTLLIYSCNTTSNKSFDLTVSVVSDVTRLDSGNNIRLSATITNIGNGESESATLVYYQSNNRFNNSPDSQRSTESIPPIASTQSYNITKELTAEGTNDTYFWVCITNVNNDIRKSNNCSNALDITINFRDLQIAFFTVSRTSIVTSQEIDITAQIINSGNIETEGRIDYYQLDNANTDVSKGNLIESIAIAQPIKAGAVSLPQEVSHTVPRTSYYGVCVRVFANESNKENNCYPRIPVIISASANSIDPLYSEQWYLKNTGQTGYSDSTGVIGIDLNLGKITQTGEGVVVNIVDTGLEFYHEDLVQNITTDSVNFHGGANPTNFLETEGDHGTSVAGIVAAVAKNGLGGRGVAPNTKLIAYNFLGPNVLQTPVRQTRAILATADINNQSYNFITISDIRADSAIIDAYEQGVTTGRNKKGKIYVKSAGNRFESRIVQNGEVACKINSEIGFSSFTQSPITCENANMDPVNSIFYNILVGAVNAKGIKSSYSTAGSAIFISGLAGEGGISEPAIITTDQIGCDKGYSRIGGRGEFNRGNNPIGINTNCNYTNTFNGTSSAAPTVTGVIALMLEANADLSWRDVRHILANTARKIDASRDAVKTIKDDIGGFDILNNAIAELGWTRNSAGLDFHNWYGFGLVDASAAVQMALNYNTSLGDLEIAEVTNTAITDINDRSSISANSTISFPHNLTIESVQVDIQITHPRVIDLGIFLVSPSGAESLLLNPFNQYGYIAKDGEFMVNADLNMALSSQAFYGEQANGNWKIRVIDYLQGEVGTLDSWELKIFGH